MSAPSQIRVGVIGCGQIAQGHLRTYTEKVPAAKVVAVCDINRELMDSVAKRFNVENTYTDFRELLKRDDIDAVDVCLHNNYHMPATVEALKAGKHVYCEKPMAGSYVDALTMYETARQTGRKLSIQLATLYSNETRAARMLIEQGELGEVFHARSTGFRRRGRPFVDGYGTATFVQKRNSAGGALYDMGVYHITAMLHLIGNPNVTRISGKTYQKTDMHAGRREQSRYDVEELGMGFVRFEGDLTMDIIEAWAIHLDSFEGSFVLGSKGGVRLSPFGFYRRIGDFDFNCTTDLDRAAFRWSNVEGMADMYSGPQQHWIAALQGRCELLPTAELALNTMLISEGIYLSNQLGREVTAEEVKQHSKSTAVKM